MQNVSPVCFVIKKKLARCKTRAVVVWNPYFPSTILYRNKTLNKKNKRKLYDPAKNCKQGTALSSKLSGGIHHETGGCCPQSTLLTVRVWRRSRTGLPAGWAVPGDLLNLVNPHVPGLIYTETMYPFDRLITTGNAIGLHLHCLENLKVDVTISIV